MRFTVSKDLYPLMGKSLVTGFFSWGNSLKRSWFVQALVNVFQEFATTEEIMWMMTRVNRHVKRIHEEKEANAIRSIMLDERIAFS